MHDDSSVPDYPIRILSIPLRRRRLQPMFAQVSVHLQTLLICTIVEDAPWRCSWTQRLPGYLRTQVRGRDHCRNQDLICSPRLWPSRTVTWSAFFFHRYSSPPIAWIAVAQSLFTPPFLSTKEFGLSPLSALNLPLWMRPTPAPWGFPSPPLPPRFGRVRGCCIGDHFLSGVQRTHTHARIILSA